MDKLNIDAIVRNGIKARRDHNAELAITLFKKAAVFGNGVAMLNLAVMYSNGEGLPTPDLPAAFAFAQHAAITLKQTGSVAAYDRAVIALNHMETNGVIVHPHIGTDVELVLMATEQYDGARGTVHKIVSTPARAIVMLTETGKKVSVALKKVRVLIKGHLDTGNEE